VHFFSLCFLIRFFDPRVLVPFPFCIPPFTPARSAFNSCSTPCSPFRIIFCLSRALLYALSFSSLINSPNADLLSPFFLSRGRLPQGTFFHPPFNLPLAIAQARTSSLRLSSLLLGSLFLLLSPFFLSKTPSLKAAVSTPPLRAHP